MFFRCKGAQKKLIVSLEWFKRKSLEETVWNVMGISIESLHNQKFSGKYFEDYGF